MPALTQAAEVLIGGADALEAAVAATVVLEDEPTLNAGTGSNIRMDGVTVQMDAAVMNDRGDFGAVAVIERVKNPVLVAREVMKSPHLLLAGEGATSFARSLGMLDYDPRTSESLTRYTNLLARMKNGGLGEDWKEFDWRKHWNFPTALAEIVQPSDTVGVVARDGRGGFAAAISTGGTAATLYGRVGDVPLMGAGIYAGRAGAVATTGWGEYIIREQLARRVYDWMAEGKSPRTAVELGLALYPPHVGIGLIAISSDGMHAGANTQMAWAGQEGALVTRADTTPPSDPPSPDVGTGLPKPSEVLLPAAFDENPAPLPDGSGENY
jgi:isoaspartyl peptidase/L-asparaginase-like protein (Ntn-hydrolase superfamily)